MSGGLIMALTPLRVHEYEGSRITFTCTYRSSERHTIQFMALTSDSSPSHQSGEQQHQSRSNTRFTTRGGVEAAVEDEENLVNYYSLGAFRCGLRGWIKCSLLRA